MLFEQTSVSNKYSNHSVQPIIEINTLEELLNYVKIEGHEIIISDYVMSEDNKDKGIKWALETYDGYRE